MSRDIGTLGIRLEKLSRDNADLVLSWRNADHVRGCSLDDEPIEPAAHLRFVDDLSRAVGRNCFLVHLHGVPMAVLNLHVTERVGSWGCYLGGQDKDAVRPGVFSIMVALSALLAFDVYGCHELRSDVVGHNVAPQRMNTYLEISVASRREILRRSGERIEVLHYVLSREQWPTVSSRISKTLTNRQQKMLLDFKSTISNGFEPKR